MTRPRKRRRRKRGEVHEALRCPECPKRFKASTVIVPLARGDGFEVGLWCTRCGAQWLAKHKETVHVHRWKKWGYEVRTEIAVVCSTPFDMFSAYTPSGDYIGSPRDAAYLCKRRGIAPEKADPNHGTCSIGFCESDGKWYGWSHRAIVGFAIGNKLFEEKFSGATPKTKFIEHGRKTIKTLGEARQAASNFARSVS